MTIDDPTDEQVERLADIADEGLETMTSEVLVDKSFDPMTPAFRVMALFKFLMQYIVRALRVHSPEKELREILIEIIDEELSAAPEGVCKRCGHKKSEHVAGSGFCRNENPGAFAGTTLCTCNGFQS
jgi:hypothetical protein